MQLEIPWNTIGPAALGGGRVQARRFAWAVPWAFGVWMVAALAWRAPSLLFSELNWDEQLYGLVADGLLRGVLPYDALWDRKPVGLFLLLAPVRWLGGEGALALRVAGGLALGAGAWSLAAITLRLMPGARAAAAAAGVLWMVYAGRADGAGVNAELLFVPLNLAGLCLLLDARGRAGLLAAGLLMGVAAQVKYSAMFSWVGFAVVWWALRPAAISRAAVVVAGLLAPSLAVMAWYGLAGRFDLWVAANVAASFGPEGGFWPVGVATSPVNLAALPFLAGRYAVVLLAGALGLVAGRRRLGLVLLGWIAAELLGLVVLRRFADHMIVQLLPPLCIAAGCLVARLGHWQQGQWQLGHWRMLALAAGLLALLTWDGREMARPFAAAAEVLRERSARNMPHWGDPAGTAGALLRANLRPGEGLYVFGGPILGLYRAAGRLPPTRFPFAEHLWKRYAPVDGVAEIARVLATAPHYIAVTAIWAPGRPAPEPAARPVFAALHTALARDYALEATVSPFVSQGGGPIGPRETVLLFRRLGD